MKRFNHIDRKVDANIKAQMTDLGRIYTVPDGTKLWSVTTVLSILSRDGIAKWKELVGEDEAAKISSRAALRGSRVHALVEDKLHNKPVDMSGEMPIVSGAYSQISQVLDQYVDNIYGIEVPLYSTHLGLAGRADLIAEFDGKPAIIDIKTSDKLKKKEFIHQYFMQECAYAIMYEEQTGIAIPRLVTIIGTDAGTPQVFVQPRDRWVDPLFDTIDKFAESLNQK